MGVSKIVYEDKTLIDLTETTVTPSTLKKGVTAINSAGELIEGTMVSDANCVFKSKTEDGVEQIAVDSLKFVETTTNMSLFFATEDENIEFGSLEFTV